MSTRAFERKRVAKTMKNVSCLANERAVARKPQNRGMSTIVSRPYHLEKTITNDRSLWNNECDRIIDLCGVDYQLRPFHSRHGKQTQETKKQKNDAINRLDVSMRNLSLDIDARSLNFEFAPYVHRNLEGWVEQVVTEVGPDKHEVEYHKKLRDLLKRKGFDVGYEVPLVFERLGSQPIHKRADLIISMPGEIQRILIECKAKKKIRKKDFEQVLFYRHHFGIPECYLVNFRGTDIRKLK